MDGANCQPDDRRFCVVDLPDPVPNADGVLEFLGPDRAVHVVCAASAKDALEASAAYGGSGCQTAYEVDTCVACGAHDQRPAPKTGCCG